MPEGEKFLTVSFPVASSPGAETGASRSARSSQSATVRVTRASGEQLSLDVHPTSHAPDRVAGSVGSDPVSIPDDAVAVEFVDAAGSAQGKPSLHVHSLEQRPAPEFAPLAAAPAAAKIAPYAAGPGALPQVSPELIGSAVLGSAVGVAGSLAFLGVPGGLPTPGPVPGPGAGGPLAGLNIITRAQWGANESWRTWGTGGTRAQCVTIHHSAMEVGSDPAANVRAIYQYHATRLNGGQGWGDIGYHLLIDPAGRIYQGRHTGVEGRAVFTNSSGTLQSVTAGHVGGANNGNIGICLLGNFTNYGPTPAAINSTVRAVSAICRALRLDPRSQVHYSNGSRSAWKPAVSGHRDWADFAGATACPGNRAYPLLGQIRARA